jgi:uncharacterized phage protein gp47/JayE
MPIQRITANQFAAIIANGITDRDNTWDVTQGEVPDLCMFPQGGALESAHDDSRKVSLMLTLSNAQEFDGPFEVDLEGIVLNEGLTRIQGGQASASAVFSRSSAPSSDTTVQRGYPIATAADEATGLTITFVATQDVTMFAASASSYFNIATKRYELTVPVVAVVEGVQGAVAANRINRPLRPLVGFDSVTNPTSATGGRDRETNQALIDRYLIAIIGRELSTNTGVKKVVVDDFPDVSGVLVVSGTNPLLTRAGTTAGAVDTYLIGSEELEQVESPPYIGAGQLIPLSFTPVDTIESVQDLSTGTTFTVGVDYDVIFDTTGVARSTRGMDGIRFRFTGAAPAIGAPVTITYTYNNLVRRLQVALETDDFEVEGRDLLFKEGTAVPIILNAQLKVLSGFSSSAVLNAVRTAILNFFGTLGLGDPVQGSDIQGVVRQVSGVDNFIFTRLTRSTVPSGTADININPNEYATLATGDLTIVLI